MTRDNQNPNLSTALLQQAALPRVEFGKDVKLPALPVDKEGNAIESAVGSEQERATAFLLFQKLWARAGQKPPVFEEKLLNPKDLQAYNERKAASEAAWEAYNSNPLLPYYKQIQAEVAQEAANSVAEKALLNNKVQALANNYMHGIDVAIGDPSLVAKREGAMSLLLQWPPNVMGAASEFLFSIPWVGQRVEAVKMMAQSWMQSFSDKNAKQLGYDEAFASITQRKSLQGAAAMLFPNNKDEKQAALIQSLLNEGMGAFADPASLAPPLAAKPASNPAAAQKQAAVAPKPATAIIPTPGNLPNGVDVPSQTTPRKTSTATFAALHNP